MDAYEYQRAHDKSISGSMCVAAVVKVVSFSPTKMTVNVQPLSKKLQGGAYMSQPQILGIPVTCTRCGGFIMRPWYKAGDIGVVVYLDHDIDSALSGGKESKPETNRGHASNDAVFIGGIVSGGFMVNGLPEESLALATEDGEKYIAITKEKIEIKGDVEVKGTITSS